LKTDGGNGAWSARTSSATPLTANEQAMARRMGLTDALVERLAALPFRADGAG
jgi:hypothetical protein